MFPFRVILRKSLVILLALLMQGPALLVQEVAWINMLVTYTQNKGLRQGVAETFDGAHPCELCKAAEKMRREENRPKESQPVRKIRENLVWGAMIVPAGRFRTPPPGDSDLDMNHVLHREENRGQHVDGPEPPPPRMA